jgi:hypothetical protein
LSITTRLGAKPCFLSDFFAGFLDDYHFIEVPMVAAPAADAV